MASLTEQKAAIRKASLARRDAMPATGRIEASLLAAEKTGTLPANTGTIVGGYWPIRSEFDPRPVMQLFADAGCVLALPAVTDATTIEFRELVRGADLVEGGFGTMAPPPDARIVDPGLLLMPLAAFDAQGTRCGYGAGHYDRYISKRIAAGSRPMLVGLAFASQQVDNLPAEAHDQPLDGIWTEDGLTFFTKD
jgi:5-formyltetrahydrofolate cyclo-ligase